MKVILKAILLDMKQKCKFIQHIENLMRHMYKVRDTSSLVHHFKQEESILHWNSQNI